MATERERKVRISSGITSVTHSTKYKGKRSDGTHIRRLEPQEEIFVD